MTQQREMFKLIYIIYLTSTTILPATSKKAYILRDQVETENKGKQI